MTQLKKHFASFAAVTALFLILLCIWQPFGFNRIGLYEEGSFWSLLDRGFEFGYVTDDMPLELRQHLSRPLSGFPSRVALALTPDHFGGFHIVLFVSLWGYGAFTYGVMRLLIPHHPAVAFVAAVLAMFTPADTGLMGFRSVAGLTILLFYMMSVWVGLVIARLTSLRAQMIGYIILWIVLSVTLLMYEVIYLVVLVTTLVFIWDGWVRKERLRSKRMVLLIAAWLIPLMVVGSRTVLILSSQPNSYVRRLGGGINPTSLIPTAITGVFNGLTRMYGVAWIEAVELLSTFRYLLPGIGIVMIAGILLIFLSFQKQKGEKNIGIIPIMLLTGIGIGMAIFAYIPFTLTAEYRASIQRTFIIAGAGAGISTALGVYLVSRLLRRSAMILFIPLSLILIGLSGAQVLTQHATYDRLSQMQTYFFGQLLDQLPNAKPYAMIVVIDDSGILGNDYFWGYQGVLSDRLQSLYRTRRISGTVCQSQLLPGTTIGHCIFHERELEIKGGDELSGYGNKSFDYDDLIIFRHTASRKLHLIDTLPAENYAPQRWLIPANGLARERTVLACIPYESCSESVRPKLVTYFFTHLDTRQGDRLPVGLGWLQTEYRASDGVSYCWMVNENATIHTWLALSHEYRVTARVIMAFDPEQLKNLTLKVNGDSVPLTVTQDDKGAAIFTGVIRRGMIGRTLDHTELTWGVPFLREVPNTPLKIALAFDWVSIQPLPLEEQLIR
jgi:hypothetical protein